MLSSYRPDLSSHILARCNDRIDIHSDLEEKEAACRLEYRGYFVAAETERLSHDDRLNRKLLESEKKEQRGKDERTPSDMELREGAMISLLFLLLPNSYHLTISLSQNASKTL